MSNVERLARREKAAEVAKGKADAAWREAWWATTMALGEVTGRQAIGDAQRLVREVTGQSDGYVKDRTRVGRALGRLETTGAPPRMAMEVVRSGVDVTQDVIEEMIQAERDGVSLREFTEQITGNAWADTPEGASEATIERIVHAQPVAVARAVVQHPPARRAAERESATRHLPERDEFDDQPEEGFVAEQVARDQVDQERMMRSADGGHKAYTDLRLAADTLARYGHDDLLRSAKQYVDGLVESLDAETLTPEMFQ